MRTPLLNLNLDLANRDPRDGGAPNPSAKSRLSLAMSLSASGDDEEPRDGG